ATLDPRKNIDVNLRALAELGAASDWRYEVIGDGPEETRLKSLSRELGLQDRVVFAGRLPWPRVLQRLRESDVFLMVSRDTFGIAYLEAMASGCLVVGALDFGASGIIAAGRNGFLCPLGSQRAITKVLAEIAGRLSTAEASRLVANSLATVADYTIEKAAMNYLRHILAVAAGGNPGTCN
ncbi:MAG: glycosyltransferase, partial [Candidatus Aminicenantes bacterium]|nr:glycosyltransferase [Candidatus Aminicenantes bacterium]